MLLCIKESCASSNFNSCYKVDLLCDCDARARIASPSQSQLERHLIHYYNKKLFSLNSSVMDDNHDRYKTANIEINQLFLNV
jgi:hypothetical protein